MEVVKNSKFLATSLDFENQTILDVGSGDGSLTRWLTKMGGDVSGLECSKNQLKKARTYPSVGNEQYIEGVAEEIPCDDHIFDIVIFFNSLHHVPIESQFQALQEAHRVLKESGILYISEPLAQGDYFDLLQPIDDETFVRSEAIKNIQRYQELNFSWDLEATFIHPVCHMNFETFCEKIILANEERKSTLERLKSKLKTSFYEFGSFKEGRGYVFPQPTKVNILKKQA